MDGRHELNDFQEPAESAPTEAWLFAQLILGKPIPPMVSPEARVRIDGSQRVE